jgi:hypothetical protein
MWLNVSLSTCFDTGNEGDVSEKQLNFENDKADVLGLFFYLATWSHPGSDGN